MFAALPMYDWPEVSWAVDSLWESIALRLRAAGIDSPDELERSDDLYGQWTSPELLLGQTCGLPYVEHLRGRVRLVGALVHDLPDCEAGNNCSVVVCRDVDDAAMLDDFRDRVAAINSRDSQSGHASLVALLAPLARGGRFFREVVESGSHRESIRLVADGRADVAAIDGVSWRLAVTHEPAARRLRVLARTPQTPGLPLIVSSELAHFRDLLDDAVGGAVADLDPSVREALFIVGYRSRPDADYDMLAELRTHAGHLGYAELA